MEKSLEFFSLMSAFAQLLAIGFAFHIGRLVLKGAKISTALKFWFGFAVLFEGFEVLLIFGFTDIFNLSLIIRLIAILAGILMLWYGRKLSYRTLDKHLEMHKEKTNSS